MAGSARFAPFGIKERENAMIRSLFIGVFLAVACLAMTSCATCKQSIQNKVPFHCIVQTAGDEMVIYEIQLDGKLITSTRTIPKEKATQMHEFAAFPGDHVLTVTAPGCAKWEKTITLTGGTKYGQTFQVELKKSEK